MNGKSRKSVGVITLFDLNNFGNRLQNYAVVRILTDLGYDVDTVRVYRGNPLLPLKEYLKYLIARRRHARYAQFYAFSKEYTRLRNVHAGNTLRGHAGLKRYGFFSVGSDQVWNSRYLDPSTKDQVLEERLLAFVEGGRRMSFAASFSVNDIPEPDKAYFARELSQFAGITVREEQGRRIIAKLLPDTPVDVVLDPTLLVDRDEWERVSSDDVHLQSEYVLEIFICPKSDLARGGVEYLADGRYARISVYDDGALPDGIGPRQFVELVSKARYVVTDSFHAVAFSIIFNRQFFVFKRSDKSQAVDSRFITLFDALGIEGRMIEDTEQLRTAIDTPIDFDEVNARLASRRSESLTVLEAMAARLDAENA